MFLKKMRHTVSEKIVLRLAGVRKGGNHDGYQEKKRSACYHPLHRNLRDLCDLLAGLSC